MGIWLRGKSWYYDFQYQGKRHVGCIGPASKTIAKEIFAKTRAEVIARRHGISANTEIEDPPFDIFLAEYLAYYKAGHKTSTYLRVTNILKAFGKIFNNERLLRITPHIVSEYKRSRFEQGKAPGTIHRELMALNHFFNKAVEWGKLKENPMIMVDLPNVKNERTRFLSEDEEQRLLEHCNPRFRCMVIIAIHTGMCLSKLSSLKWVDIDFTRNITTVQAAYAKSGESRVIPLSQTAKNIFLKLHDIKPDWTEHVFYTNRKGSQTTSNIWRMFNRATRLAGISNIHFHDLRHTFASTTLLESA
jgi:integrase